MIKKLKYKSNNIKNKNMTETDILIKPNCKNIFIKIILLGPVGVGKKIFN